VITFKSQIPKLSAAWVALCFASSELFGQTADSVRLRSQSPHLSQVKAFYHHRFPSKLRSEQCLGKSGNDPNQSNVTGLPSRVFGTGDRPHSSPISNPPAPRQAIPFCSPACLIYSTTPHNHSSGGKAGSALRTLFCAGSRVNSRGIRSL